MEQKKEIVERIRQLRNNYLSENELLSALGREFNLNKQRLRHVLNELVDEKVLIVTERHKYALVERSGLIKGRFIGNSRGFGFVEPEDKTMEDIFIPERRINGAVHGDDVLARIVPKQKGFGRQFGRGDNDRKEGEVITIVRHNTTQIVGTFTVYAGGGVIVPDDKRFADQVFVHADKTMNARSNMKVVAKILNYPTRTTMALGEIIEILGDVNEVGVDTLSIIRSYGLYETFPEIVEQEAKKVAVEPTAKDKKDRRDFTKDLVFTIDGEDARDFDDAISLRKDKDDYILQVHIADVSHYVKLGGEIDKEAYNRATSVYFPDHVLPMLPVALSNNVCSLNPNVERLTLSVEARFDKFGNIKDYQIVNGVIKSKYRMTYTLVSKILDRDKETCDKYKEIVPMIYQMEELASLLIKRRDNAGNLDFDLPEVQIVMDEKNRIKEINKKPRTMADRLIEQFMVVTNEIVARHAKEQVLPFVYRVHEIPTPERMRAFNDFIKGIGMNLTIKEVEPTPKDIQKVIVAVKDRPMQHIVNGILLRSMQKARYFEEPLGHFGLALEDYCHFTSPIRRYPDLTIHRIIKLLIAGKLTEKEKLFFDEYVGPASEHSSEMERLADEAERAVDDLKKAEYMAGKIGEMYDGRISGLTENGFFVELDNTIEGFVATETLPQDRYYFDERNYAIIGKSHKYRLGQEVKISVARADVVTRKIDFELVLDEEPVNPKKGALRPKKG